MFTEWIIKSLKKGGEANVILPDGIFTNIANDKLKKLILDECFIESIISLPVGTFFNTPKKTFILTLHKRTDTEKGMVQPYPVFAYLCSTIGETMDTYRFDIEENDLKDAVSLYTLYKGAKGHQLVSDAVNSNPRAKLLDMDVFSIDANWDINLSWSDMEKEKLGIKKKDNIMSVDEFNSFVGELINDIKDYQEAILCLE